MKPKKALSHVLRYGELTRTIKDCTRRIHDSLNKCHGVDGGRIKSVTRDTNGTVLMRELVGEFDSKNRDTSTHLYKWYTPEYDDDGCDPIYTEITLDHMSECQHCYEAHLAIQAIKAAKKELGKIKGIMSRSQP